MSRTSLVLRLLPLLLVGIAALGGCGQKGPLTLAPAQSAASVPAR